MRYRVARQAISHWVVMVHRTPYDWVVLYGRPYTDLYLPGYLRYCTTGMGIPCVGSYGAAYPGYHGSDTLSDTW